MYSAAKIEAITSNNRSIDPFFIIDSLIIVEFELFIVLDFIPKEVYIIH